MIFSVKRGWLHYRARKLFVGLPSPSDCDWMIPNLVRPYG